MKTLIALRQSLAGYKYVCSVFVYKDLIVHSVEWNSV